MGSVPQFHPITVLKWGVCILRFVSSAIYMYRHRHNLKKVSSTLLLYANFLPELTARQEI